MKVLSSIPPMEVVAAEMALEAQSRLAKLFQELQLSRRNGALTLQMKKWQDGVPLTILKPPAAQMRGFQEFSYLVSLPSYRFVLVRFDLCAEGQLKWGTVEATVFDGFGFCVHFNQTHFTALLEADAAVNFKIATAFNAPW